MELLQGEDTIVLTVTELAGYAYAVDRPMQMTEKYGFARQLAPTLDDVADEASDDPRTLGIRHHISRATDVLFDAATEPQDEGADSVTDTAQVAAEVELAWRGVVDGQCVELRGRCDSIAFDGQLHTVEEVKTLSSFRDNPNPFTEPSHFAQAVTYAFLLCERSAVERVAVQLTFIRRADGEKRVWRAVFGYTMLSTLVLGLLHRAMPFFQIEKERLTLRLDELRTLPFPYPTMRPGQEDFVREAFRTVRRGGRLFVSAPCGIGKTMSSLYPALRGIGHGSCDRIFYATAKTITGKAALEAAEQLSVHAPHMRAILLLAKELLCTAGDIEGESSLALKCPICPALHNIGWDATFQPYAKRKSEALLELLTETCIYTPERIRAVAQAHEVCPHELSLSLSEFCDLIICDYNYVFDDNMRLKRYFKDTKRTEERYVFLVDEAHNLPDRARAMLSASLTTEDITGLRLIKDRWFREDEAFEAALAPVEEWFRILLRQCEKESTLVTIGGKEKKCGYVRSTEIPPSIGKRFGTLTKFLTKYIRSRHEFAGKLVGYRALLHPFVNAAAMGDKHFCFLASAELPVEPNPPDIRESGADAAMELPIEVNPFAGQMTVQILCLDPGERMDAMLHSAKAAIFFSATLSPFSYYQSTLGSADSVTLDLPSPYEKENLCLVAYDGVSTRFSDRRSTAADTAEVIVQAVEAKAGHYIVYFPSYAYMQSVYRIVRQQIPPYIQTIRQKSGMSIRDREQFLRLFSDKKYAHLVGFCVLGGMFSEGIDLRGESLIGAIIVGTGLPGISPELNLMAEYYQNLSENGREFAYIYPGMNKVLQAAGRVIRSETDRGMVLLIDDRFAEPGIQQLFPPHWQHLQYTRDPMTLSHILEKFWGKGEKGKG